MSTWYKKAKMADKATSPDQIIYSVCQFCKRWKTVPDNADSRSSETQWKKEDNLTPEEKSTRVDALSGMSKDINSPVGVSHGICDVCDTLMEKIGWPGLTVEMDDFISQSLAID